MASIVMKNQNEKSKYVPRVLERGDGWDKDARPGFFKRSDDWDKDAQPPISDMKFARLPGPKVLLGAPGGGKTSLCEEVASELNGQLVRANIMASGSFKGTPKFDEQILVIDGLDEVSSMSTSKALAEIIKTIERLGYGNWLISCRSYEWNSELFDPLIKSTFDQSPEIAHLGDLTNEEIKALLEIFSVDEPAEQFIKNAEQKEVTDFLRNPQNLKLLVDAVRSDDRTETKTDLFYSACKVMASENNILHKSKNSDRPTKEQMIDIAGWICVQFLMSGAQAIALDGQDGEKIPRPADLIDSEYPIERIKATCQTKIFKPVRAGRVVPVHRTVAEFLAGAWLAKVFKTESRKVSPSRVMNYLTSFGAGAIPPNLYGLYAWVVSLYGLNRCQNMKHNPYVCLRYGDLSKFSNSELKDFLKALEEFAENDPYFRLEDWHARFNRSLGRVAIKDEFLKTIYDNDISTQLRSTLLQAIRQTELAGAIVDDLKTIALNQELFFVERSSAVEALEDRLESDAWINFANRLLGQNTEDSVRISIEVSICNKLELFSGRKIAEHLIIYENVTEGKGTIGVGFRILQDCSEQQALEIAKSLSEKMSAGKNLFKQRSLDTLEFLFSGMIFRLLKGANESIAHDIWMLILQYPRGHRAILEDEAGKWFSEHDKIRRKLQYLALDEAQRHQTNLDVFDSLLGISSGLRMNEGDVIYHLKSLILKKDTFSDWQNRWKDLVKWAQYNYVFDGNVLNLVEEQVKNFPELEPILKEIPPPPINAHEIKYQELERKQNEENLANIRQKHENFSQVREVMEHGKDISVLGSVAYVVLRHHPNCRTNISLEEKIAEMVGRENLASVIAGFKAVVKRDDIPSIRDCINLQGKDNKVYYIERISLALCMLMLEKGESLTSLPKKMQFCALMASLEHGGLGEKLLKELRSKLSAILFKDPKTKRNLVKDMIEPSLEAGKENPLTFYYLKQEEILSDILPTLALEWLTKFENIDERWRIDLFVCIISSKGTESKDELKKVIDNSLKNGLWTNEKQRSIWHVVAFALDFDYFHSAVCKFANEDKQHLWSFRDIIARTEYDVVFSLPLNVDQIAFLLRTFAPHWSFFNSPSGDFVGSENSLDATEWLRNLIDILSRKQSEEAIECFEKLIASGRMDTYQDYVKHKLAQTKRTLAEANHLAVTLTDVREILSTGKPVNVSDLQTLFIEKLEDYQARIRTGHTNTYKIFWDRDEPHVENYCRDRLLDGLEQEMGAYGVRVHKEGAMANETRVDLLFSCGDFDLPVEIKRQWHPDIWTAAHEQLERYYTDNYRTDGTGVYLVIWHGPVKEKPIPKPPIGNRPKSADEMRQALLDNSGDLLPETKIVVLDVSKPASKKK